MQSNAVPPVYYINPPNTFYVSAVDITGRTGLTILPFDDNQTGNVRVIAMP